MNFTDSQKMLLLTKQAGIFCEPFIMETKRRLRYEREAACVQKMSARTEE